MLHNYGTQSGEVIHGLSYLIIISINAGIISLEDKPLWKISVLLIFDVFREPLLRAAEKTQANFLADEMVKQSGCKRSRRLIHVSYTPMHL